MASIISAGTSTGTALNLTGDTTGILQLASNSGTTAITINTSQQVGIGTSSPATTLDVRATYTSNTTVAQIGSINNGNGSTPVATQFDFTQANGTAVSRISSIYTQNVGQTALAFSVYNAGLNEAMRIISTGQVGIGTTTPALTLNVKAPSGEYRAALFETASTAGPSVQIKGSKIYELRSTNTGAGEGGGLFFIYDKDNEVSRLAIDNNGNIGLGVTSVAAQDRLQINQPTSGRWGSRYTVVDQASVTIFSAGTGGIAHYFVTGAAYVGAINCSGSATTYVSASDYRLKEDIQPIQNALSDVAKMNPVTFTFKSTKEKSLGFIAHEIQEVCPQAVTGEKDAVDANGDPKYQGVDPAKLVATLVAAIQEQQALITQLQADVAALKGAK